MSEIIYSFCLGVCVGMVGTNIYETRHVYEQLEREEDGD